MKYLQSTNNVKFTWELVKRKYPWLKVAVRRYFFKPTYFISDLKEVPLDQVQKVVISTWSKDFSKKVKATLINKFRNVMRNKGRAKKPRRR